MSQARRAAIAIAFVVCGFGACDDTLIVVAPIGGGGTGGMGGTGGDGGAPTSTTTVVPTTTTVTNMGGGCQGQMPVGNLTMCGGSSVSVTGGPLECFRCIADDAGSTWESACSGDTCECRLNGQLLCTCTEAGSACGSLSCCGFPWDDPGR